MGNNKETEEAYNAAFDKYLNFETWTSARGFFIMFKKGKIELHGERDAEKIKLWEEALKDL